MKIKDFDRIAQFEKAIKKKYGELAIKNPKSFWDENKEKEYLEQLKTLVEIEDERGDERIEVNGVLLPKKLIKRDNTRVCPVCDVYSFATNDDFYMIKFGCCSKCYIQHVEDREERWQSGWRPDKEK